MNITSMNVLKEHLQKKGFECSGWDKTSPNLEVILKKDALDCPWTLILCPTTQLFDHGKSGMRENQLLQIFLNFPFSYKEETISSLSRLLMILNKGLQFPGFGLSEMEHVIYYRYVLSCENGVVPKNLTYSLVSLVLLYVDSMSPMIEAIASGKSSLHDVLADVLKLESAA